MKAWTNEGHGFHPMALERRIGDVIEVLRTVIPISSSNAASSTK
jgi:hypothetical protein